MNFYLSKFWQAKFNASYYWQPAGGVVSGIATQLYYVQLCSQ